MEADEQAVEEHIAQVASATRRRDAETLTALLERITGETPRMWSGSIIGFGAYHYQYDSGHEGDAPAVGFAARKAASTIYLPDGVGPYAEQLARLGPHSTGVGCLYLKDLAAVDLQVLEEIIAESYASVIDGTYQDRARESQGG